MDSIDLGYRQAAYFGDKVGLCQRCAGHRSVRGDEDGM